MDCAQTDGLDTAETRQRTLSSMSQQSCQSSMMNFPLMTLDSGLYTSCSSNSEYVESDTDSYMLKLGTSKYDSLQLALQEGRRLRSELERLTKSEQWYKRELQQQKSTRLEDLERIYTQERKFLQENQRLQKECLRLYEKCSALEKELEQKRRDSKEDKEQLDNCLIQDEDTREFEERQQSAVVKEHQMLIGVLRKQKKDLLDDLRGLTDEKDAKVMDLQKILADLEFDNKHIIKKCKDLSQQRLCLEYNLKHSDCKLSSALAENINLEKTIVELREQLELQVNLVKLKEEEIALLTERFKNQMQNEQDVDEVHRLSINYHEEINNKSLHIITLKKQLSSMNHEIETLQELQEQNDQKQRLIEQLKFSLDACKVEVQELKQSNVIKSVQLADLQKETVKLVYDRKESNDKHRMKQDEFARLCQELKVTKGQYALIQEKYKETQFKLELLEIDLGKLQFQRENDQQEIHHLRQKLKEYLQKTSELSEKIQTLEVGITKATEENTKLVYNLKYTHCNLRNAKGQEMSTDSSDSSQKLESDLAELITQFKRLHHNLDNYNLNNKITNTISTEKNVGLTQSQHISANVEDNEISSMFLKLQENTDILLHILLEKQNIAVDVDSAELSNEKKDILVSENAILKKDVQPNGSDASSFQLKIAIAEDLSKQKNKALELQKKLLINDAKLYKMERLQTLDNKRELQLENQHLRENLTTEMSEKTELQVELSRIYNQVEVLKAKLRRFNSAQRPTDHKGVQCLIEHREVNENLKKQLMGVIEIEQPIAAEAAKKNERIQRLQHLSELQNCKIQCLQDSQADWEDTLKSLNVAQVMEEETRKELELKRMELEELNHVFEEQNDQLRMLEEHSAIIECKRIQEKQELKNSFQQEIDVISRELHERRQEIEEQKKNYKFLKNNERKIRMKNDEYSTHIAEQVKEIRCLKSKIEQSIKEKEDMRKHIRKLEEELKEIKSSRRQGVLIPQVTTSNETELPEIQTENDILKDEVTVNHLRILTKVLEAEYNRKMQRYDQHIHSLLTNVKSLKKSLKLNEEKTDLISEEQSRTLEELKDLKRAKRKYDDMRLKYEQSQNTIQELKETLLLERKKFESSDFGKSSQYETSTYEVANLIDDYKKLIQQSASVTKRPVISTVLELIERSNQCVPNLHKIETSLGDLRNDLQLFVASYTQKMPLRSLTNPTSLTVPPSLMDELRAASESF